MDSSAAAEGAGRAPAPTQQQQPLAVDLSVAARVEIQQLLAAGAGRTPSEVIERLLVDVLPSYRAAHVREQHLREDVAALRAALAAKPSGAWGSRLGNRDAPAAQRGRATSRR